MKHLLRLMMVMALLSFTSVSTASCFTLCPLGNRPETLDTHRCCSLCLGTRTSSNDNRVAYYGIALGLAHTSMPENDVLRVFRNERCDFNGASIQLFSQVNYGTFNGFALTGLISIQRDLNGVQFSGLANDVQTMKGLQLAIAMNMANKSEGLQIGLVNIAKELKGVQIGLININSAGLVLPLINMDF